MKAGIQFYGMKEIIKMMNYLPDEIDLKVIKPTLKEAQSALLPIVIGNIKSMPANNSKFLAGETRDEMCDKLRVSRKSSKRKRLYMADLTFKNYEYLLSFSKSGDRYFIPTLIEYGHMTGGGAYIPPMPFMRPAVEATTGQRMNKFINLLRTGLLREAMKYRYST